MDVKAGHLPDPYMLDVAYAGGRRLGAVERIVMDDFDPDRLGPYIRKALRDSFTVKLWAEDSPGPEEEEEEEEEEGC